MDSAPFPSPPRCTGCSHTIRYGEPYEDSAWETHSGAVAPGVAHTPECPDPVPVPCPPCLRALLEGRVAQPHACAMTTTVAVDGVRLTVGAEKDCLCVCKAPMQESEALRAARATARGLTPE